MNENLGRIRQRRKKRHRQDTLTLIIIIVVCLLVIAALGTGIWFLVNKQGESGDQTSAPETTLAAPKESGTDSTAESTQESATADPFGDARSIVEKADTMAAMYDYDGAIELLKTVPGYETNVDITTKMNEFETARNSLVRWADNSQITHIFFHSLIVDPSLAFGSSKKDDYNMNMATITEFNKVIQTMYDEGYVLVGLHDIAEMQQMEDGSYQMVQKAIYLPQGKKPFVLSEDDVCYYEYMTGHGFASRLVIAEDGSVDTEMDLANGTSVVGDYDLIPLIDTFVEQHPDFSYHGAKGIVALTGYNGIFGYRTSYYTYSTNNENGAPDPKYYINPDIEADRAKAAEIAQRLKDTGWEIASHSWGHPDLGTCPIERFHWDCDIWEKEVETIVGDTDIIIFPFGADIGSWRGYALKDEAGNPIPNERYEYLKSLGFDYYCNVDSNPTWVQITGDYFRQGRRNIDGQRLYEAVVATDRLSDLFNSKDVIDPDRPLPVPGVTPTEAVESAPESVPEAAPDAAADTAAPE